MNTQLATIDTVCIEDKVNCILSTPKKALAKLPLFQSKNLDYKDQQLFFKEHIKKETLESHFSTTEIVDLCAQLQRYNSVKFLAGLPSFQTLFFIGNLQKSLTQEQRLTLLNNLNLATKCITFLLSTGLELFNTINSHLQDYKHKF